MERANPEDVLERISTRRDPDQMDEEERLAEIARLEQEEEDEELVKKYFARGIVPPPDIELEGEDAEGAVGDVDGLGDDDATTDGTPEAGPSGISAKTDAGPSVKRKLVDVEPDAHSLLDEESRKIASSFAFKAPPLPKKKAKTGGSSLLGIKRKGK